MKSLVLASLLLGMAVSPCVAGESENKDVVLSMIQAINDKNFDALDGLVAGNVVRHSAATPGVVVSNLKEFKDYLKADAAAVPDSKQQVEIIFGSGDMVAVRAVYTGTQTGPMGPFPASGKKVELPFMGILRLEDGKIAEMWVEWDNMVALTQLGHFPPEATGKD
jgi:steroid delta-isomerase-like uncharacterized protein